ncbi:ketosteroid isomerase-like protein [Streptomyces sp. V4I23]|uniref:nuclear transport factor 2 family protein n=1 Tax=Streptomyces sp. V4I23 TaxID=3042282 RepID=UPI002788C665|nr:nuclear transport factor 2 family protein [Streptomyces sp. V4I23]MDQ1008760.1 ketosteroid isomerase-like protein [Streptomyces sp. V4I23]
MKIIRRVAAPVIGALAGAAAAGVFLGGNATATESDSPNDRFAIREVIDRHQMSIDLRDADSYANLYAKDGHYRSPFGSADGRSEIKAMFIDLAEKGFTKGKRHMTGPAMIEVNGTTATARSWYWVAETETEHAVYATGTYTDKLRKVNGKWEIVQRVQTLDELAHQGQ